MLYWLYTIQLLGVFFSRIPRTFCRFASSSASQTSCVFPCRSIATQLLVIESTADTVNLTNRTNQYTLTNSLLHVLLQELVVGSRARRRVKGLVSSPVAAPTAATQPLVSASTADSVQLTNRTNRLTLAGGGPA